MSERPGIRGSFEDLPEEKVAELEKIIRRAGHKVGVGGYDRVLLGEAERSAVRAETAFEDGDSGQEAGATAAAVLCGSAACEARVSEYLAHYEFARGELPSELRRIRGNPNAREQWRDLLRHLVPDFDLGSSREYQRLGCLLQLRDVIAHRNARLGELGTLPEYIAPCVRQGIIPLREAEAADWTSVIFVAEVASWAFETARDWLAKADELAPLVC